MTEQNEKKELEAIDALAEWGVPFLSRPGKGRPVQLAASELIQRLIMSDSARLNLAVTAFFLVHPVQAPDTKKVLVMLDKKRAELLMCYYMAAVYLQLLWRSQLPSQEAPMLPDYFSKTLSVPPPSLSQSRIGLAVLEERFQALVGKPYDFVSSFQSLTRILIKAQKR